MFLSLLLIAVGLGVLVYSADFLVRGSSSVAQKFGLSPLFIGLTIVAFGTSLPELIVNIFASIKGSVDIAVGNVIGSNISNILLILGCSAFIFPLKVKHTTISKEIPFALLAVGAVFILANDYLIDGFGKSFISRGDGLILIGFFAIFLYYTIGISQEEKNNEADPIKTYGFFLSLIMILGGIIGLVIGGNLLVDNAITIAKIFGVSEALIGLTVVAVGTSLPELATSVVAAWRKNSDIAIGNVVGSNIFNIFWILGLSSTINPINFSASMNFDIGVCFLATLILIPFMFVGKRNILERWQGLILILLYISYTAYLIYRG